MQETYYKDASTKKKSTHKDAVVDLVIENYKASMKSKPVSYIEMTKRLAIKGLCWSEVTAEEIFKAVMTVLKSPCSLRSIKIYRSKAGGSGMDPFFGISEFESEEVAKAVFDAIDGVGFGKRGEVFRLEVVSDEIIFENPVDECYYVELEQERKNTSKKYEKKSTPAKVTSTPDRKVAYDERFSEVFEDPDYFIDTTHEYYKSQKKRKDGLRTKKTEK